MRVLLTVLAMLWSAGLTAATALELGCTRTDELGQKRLELALPATVRFALGQSAHAWLDVEEQGVDLLLQRLDRDGRVLAESDLTPSGWSHTPIALSALEDSTHALRLQPRQDSYQRSAVVLSWHCGGAADGSDPIRSNLAYGATELVAAVDEKRAPAEQAQHRQQAMAALFTAYSAAAHAPRWAGQAAMSLAYLQAKAGLGGFAAWTYWFAAHAYRQAGDEHRALWADLRRAALERRAGRVEVAYRLLRSVSRSQIGKRDQRLHATAQNDLCVLDQSQGDWRAAETCFNKAAQAFARIENRAEQANSLANLANVQRIRGKLQVARHSAETALKMAEENGAETAVANASMVLSRLHAGSGELYLSLEHLLTGRAAALSVADSYWAALFDAELGGRLRLLGDRGGAQALLRNAVAQFTTRSAWGPMGEAHLNLAQLAAETDPSSAQPLLRLAATDFTSARNWPGLRRTLHEQAAVALRLAKLDEAAQWLHRAEQLPGKPTAPSDATARLLRAHWQLKSGHLDACGQSLEDPALVRIAAADLWVNLQRSSLHARLDLARGELDAASAGLARTVDLWRALIAPVRTRGFRLWLLRQALDDVQIWLSEYTDRTNPPELERSFAVLEWIEGLRELAHSRLPKRASEPANPAADRLQMLLAQRWLEPARVDEVSLREAALLADLASASGTGVSAAPKAAAARTAPRADTLWLVSLDGPRWQHFWTIAGDGSREYWRSPAGVTDLDWSRLLRGTAVQLDAVLDGRLAALDIERETRIGVRRLLSLNPTTTGDRVRADSELALLGLHPSDAGSTTPALPNLPQVPTELREVEQLWPGQSRQIATEAGPAQLLEALGSSTTLVHIASHGRVLGGPNIDYAASLALPGAASEPGLRVLSWRDLDGQQLASPLVVLASCDSGARGGGSVADSLAEGLLLAGVQTVLAPRWPVYDDANLFAMRHFYAALASGDPVHVAYQKMRLALRGSARFSHPRYWASWALFAPGPN